MSAVIDFKSLVDINELLKSHSLPFQMHAEGGCTCSGVMLIGEGNREEMNQAIVLINDFLSHQFMYLEEDQREEGRFYVHSKFEKHKES